MDNERVLKYRKNVDALFIELNYRPVMLNNALVYEKNGEYRRCTYVKGLGGFVMEWAANTADAQNNLFEDHDIYPLSLGEDKLIDELRIQMIKDDGP